MSKKVGVIISCYNHEDFIEQAIDSVLAQTYKDIEIYVADDASSDGSREKLIQYDEKIKELHLFDQNSGGQARFLLTRVDNEYTALLNSDDYWYSDKIEKQVQYMEENPDCAACFTWCHQVNREGTITEGIEAFKEKNRSRHEWLRYFYSHGNCLAHPSILIRTEIYKELLNNNNKAFRQVPDFYMWVKLVMEKEIHIVEEELMAFRWHSSESSTNVSANNVMNLMRHQNEECYMWYKEISQMNDENFKAAFKDMFINEHASSDVEIKCEKFFVLVRARVDFIRQAAILYFYDIYSEQNVVECFENIYSFGKNDFYKLETEIGYAKMFLAIEEKKRVMREMGQCIINANI